MSPDQRFRNHPRNRKKVLIADRKIRTIAGKLVRKLERKLDYNSPYHELLKLYTRVLQQKRSDKNKIYSLHEPDVECISKGKEHKKYEFGSKVSIIRSQRGVILGVLSFRKEYDGHTIDKVLDQVFRIIGKLIRVLVGDRGSRGQKQSVGRQIVISSSPFLWLVIVAIREQKNIHYFVIELASSRP